MCSSGKRCTYLNGKGTVVGGVSFWVVFRALRLQQRFSVLILSAVAGRPPPSSSVTVETRDPIVRRNNIYRETCDSCVHLACVYEIHENARRSAAYVIPFFNRTNYTTHSIHFRSVLPRRCFETRNTEKKGFHSFFL